MRNGDRCLDWYKTIFEVIDMRSFSNLWFWIALAVLWSTVSHYVLGVPHDLVRRAHREGGQSLQDVETLAHIYVRRLLFIFHIRAVPQIDPERCVDPII